MQSKLPVRIKRKFDEKKCCCSKFLQIMIENPSDACCTFCVRKETSFEDISKQRYSRSTQTDNIETRFEFEKKSLAEIKHILCSINLTLENILATLQDKRELLYNKLHEEIPCKKTKVFYSKSKIEKYKKKNSQPIKKMAYGWPDISRLYYGQPPWQKNYMQKFTFGVAQNESKIIVSPKRHSWIYSTRPSSCPNMNYFQPLGKLFERRKAFGIAVFPSPAIALIGQGDLDVDSSVNSEEPHEETCQIEVGVGSKLKEVDEREIQ